MEEDGELEEIRRRKIRELQSDYAQMQARAEEEARIEAQRQTVLRQVLTPEARERLARIKLARPEIAGAVEGQIISAAASGKLNKQIDDGTLRVLLERLLPRKKEIKIERR